MTDSQRSEAFVADHPDFRLSLEPYDGYYFVHQEVRRFNPTVVRETRALLDRLSQIVTLKVFVAPDNTKLIRYSALFGFSYTHKLTSPYDREEYLILERTR